MRGQASDKREGFWERRRGSFLGDGAERDVRLYCGYLVWTYLLYYLRRSQVGKSIGRSYLAIAVAVGLVV